MPDIPLAEPWAIGDPMGYSEWLLDVCKAAWAIEALNYMKP